MEKKGLDLNFLVKKIAAKISFSIFATVKRVNTKCADLILSN